MGFPRIYWYPDVSGTLEVIDFGEGLSDIQELDSGAAEDAMDGVGLPYRNFAGAALRFRVYLERFGPLASSPLERALTSLQRHLYRGGLVGVTRDSARAWASVPGSNPARGDTLLYTGGGNSFSAWEPTATLLEDDEISIENLHPEAYREIQVVDTPPWTPILHVPIQGSVLYTYGSRPVVRWRHFFPVCFLPQDQLQRPIVTNDHQRNFTLDMELLYIPSAVLAIHEQEGFEYPELVAPLGTTQVEGMSINGLVQWSGSLSTLYGPGSTAWDTFQGGGR